jgi:hypothetical protein
VACHDAAADSAGVLPPDDARPAAGTYPGTWPRTDSGVARATRPADTDPPAGARPATGPTDLTSGSDSGTCPTTVPATDGCRGHRTAARR